MFLLIITSIMVSSFDFSFFSPCCCIVELMFSENVLDFCRAPFFICYAVTIDINKELNTFRFLPCVNAVLFENCFRFSKRRNLKVKKWSDSPVFLNPSS